MVTTYVSSSSYVNKDTFCMCTKEETTDRFGEAVFVEKREEIVLCSEEVSIVVDMFIAELNIGVEVAMIKFCVRLSLPKLRAAKPKALVVYIFQILED